MHKQPLPDLNIPHTNVMLVNLKPQTSYQVDFSVVLFEGDELLFKLYKTFRYF